MSKEPFHRASEKSRPFREMAGGNPLMGAGLLAIICDAWAEPEARVLTNSPRRRASCYHASDERYLRRHFSLSTCPSRSYIREWIGLARSFDDSRGRDSRRVCRTCCSSGERRLAKSVTDVMSSPVCFAMEAAFPLAVAARSNAVVQLAPSVAVGSPPAHVRRPMRAVFGNSLG